MKIYGLTDPRNGELRYVGFTSKTLEERLDKGHLSSTSLKKKSHKNSWIKSLKSNGLTPEIFLIQETDTTHWQEDEQWNIEYFKSIGCRLTNLVEGGKGTLGLKHTKETREKIGLAAVGQTHSRGRIATRETRKKMSETRKRLGLRPVLTKEQRKINAKRVGEKLRGIPRPNWVKEKISISSMGKKTSSETKKKLSDINKKFEQNQINIIFQEYISDEKLSLSKLARKYEVVPSVMFNILHEIKYKCTDINLANKTKLKLTKRSRRPRGG